MCAHLGVRRSLHRCVGVFLRLCAWRAHICGTSLKIGTKKVQESGSGENSSFIQHPLSVESGAPAFCVLIIALLPAYVYRNCERSGRVPENPQNVVFLPSLDHRLRSRRIQRSPGHPGRGQLPGESSLPKNEEIGDLFSQLAKDYPDLAQTYTIGKSLEDRPIYALALSAPTGESKNGDLLRPMVKLVANIQGDEAVGRQMVLYMAEYLATHYDGDPKVQALLNLTEIHFLPTCNPDGFAKAKVSHLLFLAYQESTESKFWNGKMIVK